MQMTGDIELRWICGGADRAENGKVDIVIKFDPADPFRPLFENGLDKRGGGRKVRRLKLLSGR